MEPASLNLDVHLNEHEDIQIKIQSNELSDTSHTLEPENEPQENNVEKIVEVEQNNEINTNTTENQVEIIDKVEKIDPPKRTCQICLEMTSLEPMEEKGNYLLTKICNDESCAGEVCQNCMGEYISNSLASCIQGLLPRIKCPICLIPMNSKRWQRIPECANSFSTYTFLAHQTLAVMPPCCHNDQYVHMIYDSEEPPEGEIISVDKDCTDETKLNQFLRYQEFEKARELFENHQLDGRSLVEAMLAVKYDVIEDICYDTIRRIQDPERQATFYLSYLYQYPLTHTHCCYEAFCFNCKRMGHHYETGECVENEDFDEEECLIECRQCRVTMLKVEGCESVLCLCGFSMNWPTEVQYSSLKRRRLLPEKDILYDHNKLEAWDTWKNNIYPTFSFIQTENMYIKWRVSRWKRKIDIVKFKHNIMKMVWRRRMKKKTAPEYWKLMYTCAISQIPKYSHTKL